MTVRAIIQSCLLHLAVVALLIFGFRSTPAVDEIPIELMEFLKASTRSAPPKGGAPTSAPAPSAPAPSAKPSSSAPEPSTAESAPSREQSTGAPSASDSASGVPGGVAEEYEVSELPALINEVRVPYPPSAKARGIQGAVVFDIIVNSRGEVQSAKVVKSPAQELSDAASSAVAAFRFKPARVKDKPVAIQIRYTYRFILE